MASSAPTIATVSYTHLDFEMLDAALFAFQADDARERADRGLVDIRDFEAGRVKLVARTHGADKRHAQPVAFGDEVQLGGYGVDRVDHIVELRQIERGVRRVKILQRMHSAAWVDVRDARAHDLDLGHAGGGSERDQLAVAVGERDVIVVDQCQFAYARARESFARK